MGTHLRALEHYLPYGMLQCYLLSLSLSHSRSRGRFNPIHSRNSARGVVDQLRTVACDELPGIGSRGVVGALLGRWGRTWAAGDHCQWSLVARSTSGPDASTTRKWPQRKLLPFGTGEHAPARADRCWIYLPCKDGRLSIVGWFISLLTVI